MNIYRDDVAFDLYIQAALEEECEEVDGSIPPAVTLYWQEQEIKRLTAELADAKARTEIGWFGTRINELTAECDRLRAALESVEAEIHRRITPAEMAQNMHYHARKALGK